MVLVDVVYLNALFQQVQDLQVRVALSKQRWTASLAEPLGSLPIYPSYLSELFSGERHLYFIRAWLRRR